MHDRDTRAAILLLSQKRHGVRAIARAVQVTRKTVRRVLSSGEADVPEIERRELGEPHEVLIRELHEKCGGNLVRVREMLGEREVVMAYSTLTSFCRRRGIGVATKKLVGEYRFEPGEEMQHDTSPHRVKVGDAKRVLQCASLVLCYSRRLYAQVYPVWNRFWAKVFLTEAVVWLGGAAAQCMLDNLSVLVAAGNGKNAVIAPEMEAFGKRFGFAFRAHELGDTNRSARVERPFHYIENNFYAGREFTDLVDLNAQMRAWCNARDDIPKPVLGNATPGELFAAERAVLRPLPIYVPEPYVIHQLVVDESGFVHLHTNCYSVPLTHLERELEVHETKDEVRIMDRHNPLCVHKRQEDRAGRRMMLDAHKNERDRWRQHRKEPRERPEETAMRASSAPLGAMIDALRRRHGGRATRILQRLHRIWLDYPEDALNFALTRALEHGLLDLGRVEKLVLQHVAGDFFRLPPAEDPNTHD